MPDDPDDDLLDDLVDDLHDVDELPTSIVFDFDGTMVDTETAVYEAVRRTFADYGLELAPDVWMTAAGTMWGASWVDDLVEATAGAVDRTRLGAATTPTAPRSTT